MFTGLVEGTGSVARIAPKGPDAVLTIRPPWPLAEAVLGESVAVSGACLTVTGTKGEGFDVDVSAETLARTTLGRLTPGAAVNLERALKFGDRLGGHLVSGHVDCVGTVTQVRALGASYRLEVAVPPEHLRLVVEKGSITVNGISLTVNWVGPDRFGLNIIPHTWGVTTLRLVKEGDSVNIETDLIGKYVARLLKPDADRDVPSGGLSAEALFRAGF